MRHQLNGHGSKTDLELKSRDGSLPKDQALSIRRFIS
jgi:hypothetical protein